MRGGPSGIRTRVSVLRGQYRRLWWHVFSDQLPQFAATRRALPVFASRSCGSRRLSCQANWNSETVTATTVKETFIDLPKAVPLSLRLSEDGLSRLDGALGSLLRFVR